MEIKFNITGNERKNLALAISELTGAPINYRGVPTFIYEVGENCIDRTGTLIGPDNRELIADLTGLRNFVPTEEHYDTVSRQSTGAAPPIASFAECAQPKPNNDYPAEGPQESDCELPDRLTIEIPLEGFTEEALVILEKLVASKETLIKKAIGAKNLPIEKTETTLQFPWFAFNADSDEVAAYSRFIGALCAAAKEQKRVTAKEKPVENEKYTFRVFLLRLGFVGDEYKTARKILLNNLSGNSAYATKGAPAKEEVAANE